MNLVTMVELARPRSRTDRRRLALLVATIAIAGAFLLAAWRVKRLGFTGDLSSMAYSDFLQQGGLRSGVAFGAVLVAICACLLTYQALRLGTAARDRRLAAFRLAGATPGDVRKLGAIDAGMAGLAGGVLAGPVYLLLSLLVQALPRMGRVLPPPNVVDLVTWPAVAILLAVVAAGLGALLGRGVVSGNEKPGSAVQAAVPVLRGVILAAFGLGAILITHLLSFGTADSGGYVVLTLHGLGVILLCAGLPALLVSWQARRLTRSADPLKVLAGGRLLRSARPVGRTMTLLAFCSVAVGFVAASAADLFTSQESDHALGFRLTGLGFAAGAATFTAFIAVVSLLAGTADDLLDQRRQLASLNVLGVGEAELHRSVQHQVTSSTAPAVAAGLLIGCFLFASFGSALNVPYGPGVLLSTAVIVLVGAGLAWLFGDGAAYLLRGQVHEATAAGNLRST
ncbi:MAG TPA: FtsX-like permease family protein [Kribbella sp.]